MVVEGQFSDEDLIAALERALCGDVETAALPEDAPAADVLEGVTLPRIARDPACARRKIAAAALAPTAPDPDDVPWRDVRRALRRRTSPVISEDRETAPPAWPDYWLDRGCDSSDASRCRGLWASVLAAMVQDSAKEALKSGHMPSWVTSRDAAMVADLAGFDGRTVVRRLAVIFSDRALLRDLYQSIHSGKGCAIHEVRGA